MRMSTPMPESLPAQRKRPGRISLAICRRSSPAWRCERCLLSLCLFDLSHRSVGAFKGQLLRKADRMGAKMIGYDHNKGEWTIEVAHF